MGWVSCFPILTSGLLPPLLQSTLSIVVLDDIERLLEYVSIGPRFSNGILQTLLVLLKKQPPKGRKLLVLGTTSVASVMEDMEITTSFNVVLNVPKLREQEIKKVLHALGAFAPQEVGSETAQSGGLHSGQGLGACLLGAPGECWCRSVCARHVKGARA